MLVVGHLANANILQWAYDHSQGLPKSSLPPSWTRLVLTSLCHVLWPCPSFRGCALLSAILFHSEPVSKVFAKSKNHRAFEGCLFTFNSLLFVPSLSSSAHFSLSLCIPPPSSWGKASEGRWEKNRKKKKPEHYYQIFLTSTVSPYGHQILLQTPEALGLFQRCRDTPVLNSDLENFKSFIPIKPDKLGQKPNSIPKWRWKTKHRNILEHSCFLQLLSYSIRIIC